MLYITYALFLLRTASSILLIILTRAPLLLKELLIAPRVYFTLKKGVGKRATKASWLISFKKARASLYSFISLILFI
jgi:hypothetical protein